ncbi:MAG: hypothetical protein WBA74_21400 [Cyclobacteriaceae bacterium]
MRILAILTMISLPYLAQAQDTGDFRPIIGLTYGTKIEKPGINIGAEYLPLDDFGVALTYEHFFTSSSLKFNSIHLEGRYYFRTGQLQYYGMLGYVRNTVQFPLRDKVSKGGLDIGVGTIYRFMFSDRLAVFAQVRYSTPNQSQFAGYGGITYLLNLL